MFIEISDGISVRVNEIEAIEKTGSTSVVHTHHKNYNSTFPYEVILQLLEIREEPKKENEGLNILKEIGTFAG